MTERRERPTDGEREGGEGGWEAKRKRVGLGARMQERNAQKRETLLTTLQTLALALLIAQQSTLYILYPQ